jgi:hypothetical protein
MYKCDNCNYSTDDNSNYNKHLKSRKHRDICDPLSQHNQDIELKKEKLRIKQLEQEVKLQALQFKKEQALIKQQEKETKELKKKEKEKAKEIEVIPFHQIYYNDIKDLIEFDFEAQLRKTTNGLINLLKEILRHPNLKSLRLGQGNVLQFYNNGWVDGLLKPYEEASDEEMIKIDMDYVLDKMIDITKDYFNEKNMDHQTWVMTCLDRLEYNKAITKTTMRRIIDSFTSFNTKEALERIEQDLLDQAKEQDEDVINRREEQENRERQNVLDRDKILERQRKEMEQEESRLNLEARSELRAISKEMKRIRRSKGSDTDTDLENEIV